MPPSRSRGAFASTVLYSSTSTACGQRNSESRAFLPYLGSEKNPRAKIRGQKSEGKNPRAKIRGQKSEGKNPRAKIRAPGEQARGRQPRNRSTVGCHSCGALARYKH